MALADDDNPYDAKAVRVEIDGHVVGHMSRENWMGGPFPQPIVTQVAPSDARNVS